MHELELFDDRHACGVWALDDSVDDLAGGFGSRAWSLPRALRRVTTASGRSPSCV
jgi:hypothetical protein